MKQLKNHLIAFSTLILIASAVHAQTFSNVVVDGSSGDRSETSIAVDPNNPQLLMATWNEFASGTVAKPGWAFSTDGGTNWAEGTIATSDNGGFDPSCAVGSNGNEYYSYVDWSGTGNYGPVDVSVSTNHGQSWSTYRASAYSADHDKPYLTVDNTSGTDSGNVYVVYRSTYLYDNNSAYTYLNCATLPKGDVNSTWSHSTVAKVDVATNNSGNYMNFADPAVGPNGTVYVAYYVGTIGVHGTPTNGVAEICVAKSSNGGSNFTLVKSFSINGAYQDALGYIRVSSIPTMVVDPTNGNVYLAFVEINNGRHIYFTRSTDGGCSWSTPMIVTQNTTGDQVFPWLTVNATGIISLV